MDTVNNCIQTSLVYRHFNTNNIPMLKQWATELPAFLLDYRTNPLGRQSPVYDNQTIINSENDGLRPEKTIIFLNCHFDSGTVAIHKTFNDNFKWCVLFEELAGAAKFEQWLQSKKILPYSEEPESNNEETNWQTIQVNKSIHQVFPRQDWQRFHVREPMASSQNLIAVKYRFIERQEFLAERFFWSKEQ